MGIFVRCFFSMFRCFLCGRLLRRPSICCTVSGDRQVAAPRYFEGHGWFGLSLIYSFPVMAAARLRKYLVFILVRVVFAYLFLFLLFIFFLSFCFKWGSEGQACAIAASVTKPGKSPPRPHRRFYLRLFRRGGLQSCRFSSWRRASGMRPPCPARGTMGQWYCLVGPQGRPAVWVSGFEMRPPPGG